MSKLITFKDDSGYSYLRAFKNIKKQFEYANKRNIPFCVVVGDNEMKTGQLAVKNMIEGSQEMMSIDELIEKFAV